MQNLIVFIEPSEDASNISAKAAKLYFNRFCIDAESACELSGVYYLESEEPLRITLKRKAEGKGIANLIHIINLRGQGDIQNRPKLFQLKPKSNRVSSPVTEYGPHSAHFSRYRCR